MLTIRRTKFFGYDLFLLILLTLTIFALAILIPAFNGTSRETRYSQKWKVILFYTKIFSVRPTSIWSSTSLQSCHVPWCIISDDKELLRDSDAVIFHGRDMPSVLPTERSTNQRWVYFVQENPHYTSPEPSKYNGVFNWTMTYKRSSDVWVPYGSYRTILNTSFPSLLSQHDSLADRNFSAEKTRLVAWASSHCSSPAFLREQYAEQLQLYIPVDIFGKCNPSAPPCPRGSQQCHALLSTYKFYLAFENGFCEDYITEKYWEQALKHDLVPVVMGGADYSKLVIPESYINVLDFSSIENLASYLKALDRNSTAYNEYFHWKKKYATEPIAALCKLCKMLHDESLPSKVHWDLGSFWGVKENCMRHSKTINDQI